MFHIMYENIYISYLHLYIYIFFFFQKLEFTVSQTKVIPNTEISIEEIRTKLRELLENKEDNESIFDYIDVSI